MILVVILLDIELTGIEFLGIGNFLTGDLGEDIIGDLGEDIIGDLGEDIVGEDIV
jgi:hypothetical protein